MPSTPPGTKTKKNQKCHCGTRTLTLFVFLGAMSNSVNIFIVICSAAWAVVMTSTYKSLHCLQVWGKPPARRGIQIQLSKY